MQSAKKIVHYIGAVVKEGQKLEGVEKGADAIRQSNLFKALEQYNCEVIDHGNISVKNIPADKMNQENKGTIMNTNILDPLLFEINKCCLQAAKQQPGFILTVGGDHSVATGTISALKEVHNDLKVIWIDAHADIIQPSMSNYKCYHGMPVSHMMGLISKEYIPGFDWLKPCLTNKDIVYIGIRDIDSDEVVTLKKHNIKCFTMDHITKLGIGNVMEKALKFLNPEGQQNPIHVSFDVDGVDPSLISGTGTKARGGLDYREIHYIMRRLAHTNKFISMDLVEINPDVEDSKENRKKVFGDDHILEGTETIYLSSELVLSALGRSHLCLNEVDEL